MACQCSSRDAPGSRNMCTAAMPVAIGSEWTVVSLAQPPEVIFGLEPSSERVKAGISPMSFASW